ncbi:MAG: hypothetical protein K2K02_06655 [Ruminococcus sp.]|nr:hypothetical protein [Ruminococcus sp.]
MGIVIREIRSSAGNFSPEIEPLTYSIQKSDLYSDATGRSAETGVLLSYPIRRNIYKIQLEYYGNNNDIRYIENMINSSTLNVTFLENGSHIVKTMYPSDREKTAEIIRNGKGLYRLSFSLIEY